MEKTLHIRRIGPVVQRSERTAHNGVVPGSNPGGPTTIGALAGSLSRTGLMGATFLAGFDLLSCISKSGDEMKVISVFNNKGGVGKTTLTFHLAHTLAELGYKVLLIDADPQCNLSIYGVPEDKIGEIWDKEEGTSINAAV